MKKTINYFLAIALALIFALSISFAGCKTAAEAESTASQTTAQASQDQSTTEQAKSSKDTLIYAINNTPSGLDIDIQGDPEAWDMLEAVFDQIIDRQYVQVELPDGRKMLTEDVTKGGQPWLAESYSLDEATRVITVTLKKGIKSAWGNELTTKDIEWTLKRNAALNGIGVFGYSVAGVDLTKDLGGLKIIDDYTYQLTQSNPVPISRFELMMSNLWVEPWDSTEAAKNASADDQWASKWIGQHGGGFGPYYVTEWTAGQQVVLEANPNYWGGPPKQFTKVIYKVIPESANQIAALKSGDIDIAYGLSAREVSELKGQPGIRIIQQSGGAFLMLWANRALNEAFKDPKVMQAINCAIPRDEIAQLAYYGFAVPMTSPIPKAVGGGITSAENWPFAYSIDNAKKLLSESAYPDGFKVKMSYNAAVPMYETVCLLIQESLAQIGIEVELQKAPAGVYDSQLRNRELEFFVYPTSTTSADPWFPLLQWYGVDHFENYGNWFDPDFDSLITKGAASTDQAEIAQVLEQAGDILLSNPPVGYIVEVQDFIAVRTEIDSWNWSMLKECKLDWLTWSGQ